MENKNEIKLHLGCGSNILPGYINIDKGQRPEVQYDLTSDILDLKFNDNSIDEIRSHHVFEHFHRYQAVTLMFVWNNWLKEKGKLIIETPDFEWTCRHYLNLMTPLTILWNTLVVIKHRKNYFKPNKWRALRHIFGGKEAEWANHLEGWDKFSLSSIYKLFGFKILNIKQHRYRAGPSPNITVIGEKERHLNDGEFEDLAKKFLEKMVSNEPELPIWISQAVKLRNKFRTNKNFSPIIKNLKINVQEIL